MSSKRTILLIDYDPHSIQKTRTPLQRAGYRVEVAGDGVSGLEAFDKLVPDLVLIEPMVPKKHGFQVCQQIKSTARGKRTPVLITTAFYKGRKHRLEAQQKYGCDGYLEKPIAEDLLLSTCRQFLIDLPEQDTAPPDLASSVAAEPAVISFPDLPLGDERHSAPLAALDDLSDDEIQARLDRMILEDDPAPAPAPPAPAPARAQTPKVLPSPVESPPPPKLEVDPPKLALELADPTPARQPQRARPAALDRPRPRAAEDLAPPRRSRLPLWIGVAAVICLGAGAALLGLLPRTGSATDVGSTVTEPRRQSAPVVPAPVVPAPLPHAEEPAEQPAQAAQESSPTPQPTSAPTLVEPDPIRIVKPPQPEPPRAPSRPAAQPAQTVPSDTKPAPPATAASTQPAAAEPTAEPPPAEPPTGEVVEAAEPQPAPSVETALESAAPQAAPPREGDLLPLAEVDRAPRPTLKPPPEYPRAARELRQEGTVVLRVLVSESGTVEQVEVESGTNFRPLREEAARAVRGWRYEPALEQGVRVRVWIVEQVTFEL